MVHPMAAVFVACWAGGVATALRLPDTSGIDGRLTADLAVDRFFALWLVFNNDDVVVSDEPFTIFAAQNSLSNRTGHLLGRPELVKSLLLDHVVLGTRINFTNFREAVSVATIGGRRVDVRAGPDGQLRANNASVVRKSVDVPNGVLVIIDDYLFPDEDATKGNGSAPISASQRGDDPTTRTADGKRAPVKNATFVDDVAVVLAVLKGVRVFQHFLARSNVSGLLNEGEEYTVFVPTDHAFQRWHPIDWGFYPFSVPEFTESVIVNHFARGRLEQDRIADGQAARTLGGREIVFRRTPGLTANGAAVVKGDTPTRSGNVMFVGEVLFVSESIVSKLHQQHRDKETPPLLAFPWFGAQFLSHAFLALERDKRFSHVTRFLNLADLAPHVSGAGYTFFVPTDTAFEELGLDKMPDNYLSNGEGLRILLNHFVRGRLYDKDLRNGTELTTLVNRTLAVRRTPAGRVYVDGALIVESEVFVYNLGTMFYIDKVLRATFEAPSPGAESTTGTAKLATDSQLELRTTEGDDSSPEVLFGDGTSESVEEDAEPTTPAALRNGSSPK